MTTLATYNFTGTNGTTPPNGSGDTPGSTVVAGTISIQGNACQFTGAGSGSTNKLRLLPVANISQGLTRITVTESSVVGTFQGVFFYQSGAVGSENGYWIYFDTGNWVVDRYDAGVATNIQAASFVGTGYYQSVPITFSYDPTGASPVIGITDGTTPHTVTDSTAGKRIAAMGVDFWSSDNVSATSTIDAITITGTASGVAGNATGAGATQNATAPTGTAAVTGVFPGYSNILRDTDTGTPLANATGLIMSYRTNSNDGTVAWSTTTGTTDATGKAIAKTGLAGSTGSMGTVGSSGYLTIENSAKTIVATYKITIVDLGS